MNKVFLKALQNNGPSKQRYRIFPGKASSEGRFRARGLRVTPAEEGRLRRMPSGKIIPLQHRKGGCVAVTDKCRT
ncbi:hypothetical protein MKJ04_12000 [Pontibacter sp. E15-1]|uniref:hypothetical protein n=1 Tax=Pontibacter sp. E15-1 TaxID=2919918 RepID=UPI001F4F9CF0|nr:hypothetical protein [Pontibacter sp. E15-1]MCJ8165564.1 hypothetical protein [Pontibacter sp. E15-1]